MEKYKVKPNRNILGLLEIVEISSGKVVKKCKSVTKAAQWIVDNSQDIN